MKDPKVTVFLSTYNQEKYIRKALDSIFMQVTSFPYEVVVADDFSTDGTRDVILEYQARYPEMLVTYFTTENLGNCRKTVNCFEKGLFRGEYVSLLEGDDYWLETDRLQVLVDFLEEHPEYVFASYKEHVIDLDGNDIGSTPDQSLLGKKFTIQDFLDGKSYSDYAGGPWAGLHHGPVFRRVFIQKSGRGVQLQFSLRRGSQKKRSHQIDNGNPGLLPWKI